jgi:hypothetical protein
VEGPGFGESHKESRGKGGWPQGRQIVVRQQLCDVPWKYGQGGRPNRTGAALNPKPKNLAGKAVQVQTDGELFWKISEGRGAMPTWKSLPEKDRWSLVRYIGSLATKELAR